MRRQLATLWLVAGLLACSPADEGRLFPVTAAGVNIVDGNTPASLAEVREGALTVKVGGTWAAQGFQMLDLTYNNSGTQPLRLTIGDVSLSRRGEKAALDAVDDVTGVDVSKAGNAAQPKSLAPDGGRATASLLTIPAGASRTILVRFANFRANPRIAAGDTVQVTLPEVDGSISLGFVARRASRP